MRAVVTGGSGFLGSHLIDILVEKKYKTICLSRGKTDTSHLEPINVPVSTVNITDKRNVEKFIQEGDMVFHTAAILGAAKASRQQYMETNVNGTVNVLEAAIKKKAKIFVFPSSFAAMGPVGSPKNPMAEDTPCKPDSLYGESKLEAEKKILEIAKDKITCIIVRPPIIYGPRANSLSAAARLFSGMQKKTFVIVGSTKNYFSLCYVKNLASAIVHFAETHKNGIHTYLIADGEPVTLNDILMLIRKAFCVNKNIVHIPAELAYFAASCFEIAGRTFKFTPLLSRDIVKGMVESCYYYDISKAKKAGYKPVSSLEEGINETAVWMKKLAFGNKKYSGDVVK